VSGEISESVRAGRNSSKISDPKMGITTAHVKIPMWISLFVQLLPKVPKRHFLLQLSACLVFESI
jgi:hypothetical protein